MKIVEIKVDTGDKSVDTKIASYLEKSFLKWMQDYLGTYLNIRTVEGKTE